MKKLILIFVLGSMLLALAGCESSSSGSREANNQTAVDDILQSIVSQSEVSQNSESTSIAETVASTEKVDVDLTALSSTMVYSEVYNMMSNPDDYIGKTVKMTGIFSSTHDDSTGKDYYACMIKDATACCAQGIEFILTDESKYPKEGDTISVIGVFDTYNEGQFRYSTLRDASIV